jgi:1-acyl-sn-glycerol-3-phosphate acyltransferase
MRFRFKQVWIKQQYHPSSNTKTVYFLNHNSWWDGLIPLYLNEYFFHQQARAMMEDKQMHQFPFFRKIGAFSVNLSNAKSSVQSLRYALKSLERPNASLFIYPEGKITPVSAASPDFQPGLSWLYSRTSGVNYVPIHIYMHSFRSSKQELYLNIGEPVDFETQADRNMLTAHFEKTISKLGADTLEAAGFSDEGFQPQF